MVYRDDWNEVEIGELGEIITGQTPRTSISENYGGNLMFLTPSDDMDKRYVTDTNRKLTQLGAKSVKNKIIPPNSICVSCIGSQLGKVVITTEQTVTNQQINTIIPNDKNDYMYLYYAMKIVGKRLNHLSKTSTAVPIINKTVFSSEKILLPPLKEQIAIAKLLSSLDDKIENNKAIIANLETQAQAIFKSRFVDFEPFQDGKFVDSELGLIPEGWEVVKANDWFEINIGKTPPRKETKWFSLNYKDIKWLSISDMANLKVYITNTSEYLTQEAVNKFNVKVVPENSVLLSFKLTVGRVGINREKITTNEAIAHFHINELRELNYLYLYLKQFNYESLGNTSSIGNAVNSKVIKAMPVLKPSNNTLEKFHEIINSSFETIYNLVKQNEILAQLRDTLLPKLMSGEIRVGQDNLEEMLEE